MAQPHSAPLALNMSQELLFAPEDGQTYYLEDIKPVFAQQPLQGLSLPDYLIPSRSSTLKPPTLVYGWRLGHDKLMQIALDHFPHVIRYRNAPALFGLVDEETLDLTEEQEHANVAETIWSYRFIVAIREHLGIGPEGDDLFNVDLLYDGQRQSEYGLTVGSNYLKVIDKDALQKLQTLIASDEPAKWYLHRKKWMWRRVVPKAKSRTILESDPKPPVVVWDSKMTVTSDKLWCSCPAGTKLTTTGSLTDLSALLPGIVDHQMSESTQTMAQYRQLGKSGLRVSVPMFSAVSFGNRRWNSWVIEEEEALPLLKAAYDRGINTIDTANMSSNGESERIIRKFMEKYTIPRENLVLITKAFFLVSPDPHVSAARTQLRTLTDTRPHANHGGHSRAALFHQVDASLARLGTPYVDVLQVHLFDAATPVEETMRALHDLVQSGKVRHLGASALAAWQLAEMNRTAELHGWTPFVCVQVEYSLLYRNPELELLPHCEYKGIGVLASSPLLTGLLARPLGAETDRSKAPAGGPFERKLRESDCKIVQRVEELAAKKSWSMSHVALAWVASKVTSPIVGVSKVEQLEQSITTGKILSDEDVKYLEELYEIQRPRF